MPRASCDTPHSFQPEGRIVGAEQTHRGDVGGDVRVDDQVVDVEIPGDASMAEPVEDLEHPCRRRYSVQDDRGRPLGQARGVGDRGSARRRIGR